jgi:hypothetical protein
MAVTHLVFFGESSKAMHTSHVYYRSPGSCQKAEKLCEPSYKIIELLVRRPTRQGQQLLQQP